MAYDGVVFDTAALLNSTPCYNIVVVADKWNNIYLFFYNQLGSGLSPESCIYFQVFGLKLA